MLVRFGILFVETERRTKGNRDLFSHKIHTVTAFRNPVFNLKPGVDLNEIGCCIHIHQEFDRCQRIIIHMLDQLDRILFEFAAKFIGHARPGRRGNFDQFLMISLDRAVPFIKSKNIAVLIGGNLNFNMTHVGQQSFHEQFGIAERRLGKCRGLDKSGFKFFFGIYFVDSPAATAAFSFKHDRITDFLGKETCLFQRNGTFRTRNDRNIQFNGQFTDGNFVAQKPHGIMGWADKMNTGFFTFQGKSVILRSKPPTGVNGNNSAFFGFFNNKVNIKIRGRIFS